MRYVLVLTMRGKLWAVRGPFDTASAAMSYHAMTGGEAVGLIGEAWPLEAP